MFTRIRPIPGVAGQVVHQPGMDGLDLLQGQAPFGDTEEDQRQVARCADHQIGQRCGGRLLLRLLGHGTQLHHPVAGLVRQHATGGA